MTTDPPAAGPYSTGQQGWSPQYQPSPPTRPRRRRRIFMWVFLAVQVLFVVLIVVGSVGGAKSGTQVDCTGLSAQDCKSIQDAADAGTAIGTGIGVAALVAVWCVADFLLAVGYGIYRIARRP